MSTSYSHCPLRRYRVCPGCVHHGNLLIACHPEGCKQWPESAGKHAHQFCFSCTKTWKYGTADTQTECNHSISCSDPGIQQIRRVGDSLELGFINGHTYLEWLRGNRPSPPPTVFANEPVDGNERQRELGMTDKDALLRESEEGTQE